MDPDKHALVFKDYRSSQFTKADLVALLTLCESEPRITPRACSCSHIVKEPEYDGIVTALIVAYIPVIILLLILLCIICRRRHGAQDKISEQHTEKNSDISPKSPPSAALESNATPVVARESEHTFNTSKFVCTALYDNRIPLMKWFLINSLMLLVNPHNLGINDHRVFIAYLLLCLWTLMRIKKIYSNYQNTQEYILNRYACGAPSFTGPKVRPEVIRSTFMGLIMPSVKPSEEHTHAEAAADRNAAANFIDLLATQLGCNPYFMQRSRADERQQRPGSRKHYWAKDLTASESPENIPDNPLIALVDVDQYLDMPNMLLEHPAPYVLYTFQPEQTARVIGNYSYTFSADNTVHYHVSGGAKYVHKVWNYNVDNIVVSKYDGDLRVYSVAYLVDRRSTSPDHQLIMLTPLGSWYGTHPYDQSLNIEGNELQRLKVNCGNGFNRLVIHTLNGVKVSTSIPMQLACAVIPVTVDDTIASMTRTSKHDISLPQIEATIGMDRTAAAVLLEYHRSKTHSKPDVVYPVPEAVRRYQFEPARYDPDAKPSMIAFMSPIIHGAFCADRCVSNERRCIKGRIEDVRPRTLTLTPFIIKVIKEFVELLIPEKRANKFFPADYDEVRDRQNRPTQRHILENGEYERPNLLTRMFMKAEAYGKITDPRAISTINAPDKRDYSMIIYSFEAVLKSQKWYAFGKSPSDIASRVADICRGACSVANTDFSRFDGHVSNVLRLVEQHALLRAFRTEFHPTIIEKHKSQQHLTGLGKFGNKYQTATARLSGSPETSVFNSLDNAFVAFLALRKTRRNGAYLTPIEAFASLGIYGGDDGLTADIDASTYKHAASMVGQSLTVEPVQRGKLGVKFLARIYGPYVWNGDMNSCCDLPRQLAKIHVTPNMPSNVTPSMKLIEKLRGLSMSDPNTPIVATMCAKATKLVGGPLEADERTTSISSWLSRFDADKQYPNAASEWMHDYALHAIPDFDYKRFYAWLDRCKRLEQMLSPPLCVPVSEPKSTVPVVIEGMIIPYDYRTSDGSSWDEATPKPQIGQKKESKYESIVRSHTEHKHAVSAQQRETRATPAFEHTLHQGDVKTTLHVGSRTASPATRAGLDIQISTTPSNRSRGQVDTREYRPRSVVSIRNQGSCGLEPWEYQDAEVFQNTPPNMVWVPKRR